MPQHVADLVTNAEIELPLCVTGIGGGEAVGVVLAAGEGLEGARQVALGHPHVAELVPADGEVALPLCVAAVGGGELIGDVLAFGEGLEGARQVALRHLHLAEFVQRNAGTAHVTRLGRGSGRGRRRPRPW